METQTLLFDLSTHRKFCSMKTRFYLHGYVNTEGTTQIFLSVTINKIRDRIPTGYYTTLKNWDKKKQRCKDDENTNLILDNLIAKTTQIKTFFYLTKKELDMVEFLNEFHKDTPSYDFLAYYESQMNIRVTNKNTLKKHKSVLNKLRAYREKLPFTALNLDFFNGYRNHLFKIGNNKSTRNSNIKVIKYYLLYAQKSGIILGFNLTDLEVGSCSGNRTSISLKDSQRLYQLYFLDILSENEQISLGYFLISCLTSLRVSDIFESKRQQFLCGEIYFKSVKTKNQITLQVIPEAMKIITHNPKLLSKKISQQKINQHLKDIAKNFKVMKRITMHVGRHTFATNYLKAGGTVQDLQIILDHASIETTMIYVHMDKEEAISSMSLLSGLFSGLSQ